MMDHENPLTRRGLFQTMAGGLACFQAVPLPTDPLSDLERRIRLLLDGEPAVTVESRGEFGPLRINGVLLKPPAGTVRLVDGRGTAREASWSEIMSANQATTTYEGLPAGSYQVFLVGKAHQTGRSGGYSGRSGLDSGGGVSATTPFLGPVGWRLDAMPPGDFVVRANGVGEVTLPAARVTTFRQEMLSGDVTRLPEGKIRVELFAGKPVEVPLGEVQAFFRDRRIGTVQLTLQDGQVYSGRLASLPAVDLVIRHAGKEMRIPLARVVALELPVPAGGLLTG